MTNLPRFFSPFAVDRRRRIEYIESQCGIRTIRRQFLQWTFIGRQEAAFAEHGFRAATMREIADAAAVNEVTVYRYFRKKQQLYWHALDWKLRSSGLLESVKKEVNDADDLRALLCGLSKTLMLALHKTVLWQG